MSSVFGGAALAVFVLMNVVGFAALRRRRNDWADVIWGPGFVVASLGGLWGLLQVQPDFSLGQRQKILLVVVTFWAFRLFWHIGMRTLQKTEEDVRYRRMRQDWGDSWRWKSYVYVFMLQGFLMLVISSPLLVSITRSQQGEQTGLLGLGLLLWGLGFAFESISDAQLKAFKSKPENKGRIMDQGLWSWSRHPNYFGDALQWWGFFCMALVEWQDFWTILSPITMTFLLLKVSGVPLLEELMKDRPGFAEYQRRTSIFFPWPPKDPQSQIE
ncbi:MAG: DUF1295 domain-containing protein [Bdellovibrionales bacterium]